MTAAPPSDPLTLIDGWPVTTAAAGWVDGGAGGVHRRGPTSTPLPLASVTKPLVAMAVLVAVEEGSLDLDQPAGPPGSTVRHLLAHTSGVGPDHPGPMAVPGTRRIYSNAGFEILGLVLEQATGFTMADYLHEAIVVPLGLSATRLVGSPAHGAESSVDDLLVVISELLTPTLLAPSTMADATTSQWPDAPGVLPGYGQHVPNPWGLGFEIRGAKHPHWTGTTNDARTFGHFGRAGTMLWVDPVSRVGCVALTDEEFGPWAIDAWPVLSDAVAATARLA